MKKKSLFHQLENYRKLLIALIKNDKKTLKNLRAANVEPTLIDKYFEKIQLGHRLAGVILRIDFQTENGGNLSFSMSDPNGYVNVTLSDKTISELTIDEINIYRLETNVFKESYESLKSAIAIIYQFIGLTLLNKSTISGSLTVAELKEKISIQLASNNNSKDPLNFKYNEILDHLNKAEEFFAISSELNILLDQEPKTFQSFVEHYEGYTHIKFTTILKTNQHPEECDFSKIIPNLNKPFSDLELLITDIDEQLGGDIHGFCIWSYVEAIFKLDKAISLMIPLTIFEQDDIFYFLNKRIICEDHPLLNNRLLLRKLYGKKLNQAGNATKTKIYNDYRNFLYAQFMTDEHKHKYKSTYEAAHQLSQQYTRPLEQHMKQHRQEYLHSTSLSLAELPDHIKKLIHDHNELKKHLLTQGTEK